MQTEELRKVKKQFFSRWNIFLFGMFVERFATPFFCLNFANEVCNFSEEWETNKFAYSYLNKYVL